MDRPYDNVSIGELEAQFSDAEMDRGKLKLLHAALVRGPQTSRRQGLQAKVWRALRLGATDGVLAAASVEMSTDLFDPGPQPQVPARRFIEKAVADLREKLIDVSKRNPLISFKHSERGATYLRIIDETLDGLHAGLGGVGSMIFEPLPDPADEPSDQKTPDFKLALEAARLTDEAYRTALEREGADAAAFEAAERALVARTRAGLGLPPLAVGKAPDLNALARANGIDPSLELPPEAKGAHHSDRKIRVLMLPDKLEGRLRTVVDRYRGHAAETGIHTLQLVLGFLEWRDAEASAVSHQAPLLTLAVDLRRETGKARFSVSGRDEPLAVNMALQEMLRRFHGLVLPEPEGGETPERWLARAGAVVAKAPGLTIRRWATLAVLPFPNMAVWRDLDVKTWPALLEHPQVGVLLGGREADGDEGGGGLGFPPDYPLDRWQAAEIPPLVLDADVSQHSALVDAMAGRSLALEGPPGTGKSQTIANMIAGALSQGRRVLFVAEKRAALEVVAQRLKSLGLGPLLLELHSDKATKGEVLGSIGKALLAKTAAPGSGQAAGLIRDELLRKRDVLKRYRSLLRQPVGRLGQAAGDLVWREMRLRAKVQPVLSRSVWDKLLPGAETIEPHTLQAARGMLEQVERTAAAIGQQGRADSPWRAAKRLPADPIGQQAALDRLEAVGAAVAAMAAWRDRLVAEAGDAKDRIDALLALTRPFATAPDVAGVPGRVLKAALGDVAAVEALARRLRQQDGRRERLREVHPEPLRADVSMVAAAVEAASVAGLGGATPADIAAALGKAEQKLAAIRARRTAAEPMLLTLEMSPEGVTAAQVGALAVAVEQLASLPEDQADLRSAGLLADGAGSRLSFAKAAADDLTARRDAMGEVRWAEVSGARLDTLVADAEALESTPALLRPFSGKVKRARATVTAVFGGPAQGVRAAAGRLRAAVAWRREAEVFAAESSARGLFGEAWRGCDSPFEAAVALRRTLETMELALRRCALDSTPALLPTRRVDLTLWAARLAEAPDAGEGAGVLAQTEQTGRERVARLSEARAAANAAGLADGVRLDTVLLADMSALQAVDAELRAVAQETSTAWFSGPDERADHLEAAAAWASALRRAVVPAAVVAHLRGVDEPGRAGRAIGRLHEEGEALAEALRERWAAFATPYAVEEPTFLGEGSRVSSSPLPRLQATLAAALTDESALRLFAELGRQLVDAEGHDARWVYDAAVRTPEGPAMLADAYELALVRSVLQSFLNADGAALVRLGGAQLADVEQRFRVLDRELASVEARRVLLERLADPVPKGNGTGPVSTHTDLRLVELVCGQKRPRITLRALTERAGRAVQAIKPVWMMSPTTVAQFAPPGSVGFDLVIIDEASQMTPEMAVGALGRGAQIVVVGDPKQLPPSNHFQVAAVGSDDDDDEGGAAQTAESILDLAYQKLGNRRRLKWHYRSRHERLIGFSNREYYDGDLVVFPSAVEPDAHLGVRSVWAGGLYKGRVNEIEARAVVEEAVGLMLARPDLSLGVVAMNADQRELLFQMFEDLKASNPAVRDYVAHWEGGTEAFFVKNLENVQGDERDVIVISTVYGPAEPGARVIQRFGLLNRHDEGHRRLNVLVTRAKRANWIVTSLRPNDVAAGPTTSRGVHGLQRYLAYAAGAPGVDATQPAAAPDSDFEVFVAERLKAHGYEVVHQVGVEKFRIDLGVRHPTYPLGYLAGVECDGAAYHSHYTVRDRDRIRQGVLEGLGWAIWRVWSTDWFNDPERETGRLLAWLDGLRARAEARHGLTPTLAGAGGNAPEDDPEPSPAAVAPHAAEAEPEAPPPPEPVQRPSGRRHEVDGFAFYDLPAMPGLFEVWDGDARIGDVERVGGATGPAKLFGGAVKASLPEYVATRRWDATTFRGSDIFAAVRRLGQEWRARATSEA